MTEVINYIASQFVYVLVTLRSDASMIDQYTPSPDGTGLPSGATDPVYQALVDSFANSAFVIFGVSSEPGGDDLDAGTISSAMNHAVGVIRTEENLLGVPHHLVSVQGKTWTSDLSFYATTPPLITYDNVVYEYHAYASPVTTYSTIPVIVGEYGPQVPGDPHPGVFDAGAFYATVEGANAYSVFIPNLAWDVEPYNSVTDDLVQVTDIGTDLVPAQPWGVGPDGGPGNIDGGVVKTYLLAH